MKTPALSSRFIANAALITLTTFPLIVIALHIVQRSHYHPLADAVSELADGRDGWLMWIAFCSAGTGLLCLAVLHRRLVQNSHAAPALLAAAAFGAYVSAVFHVDPEDAIKTSLHDQIHQTASLVAFVAVIVAMFVSSRRFRLDPHWQRLARPTLIWEICALAALLLTLALNTIEGSLFGLGQRIFIATWLSWAITISARARAVATDSPAITDGQRDAVPAQPSGLEDALEPLEVLLELLPRPPLHDPRREPREKCDLGLADHPHAGALARGLELMADGERHRAVERSQREDARRVEVRDLERRVELPPEHVTRLGDPGACTHLVSVHDLRAVDAVLPPGQVGHVREVREHVLRRPLDLDRQLRAHRARIGSRNA
jgi:hypothetical protein